MTTHNPSQPFDETSKALLQDPEQAVMYLEEILADGDIELFKAAIKQVAAVWFPKIQVGGRSGR